MSFEDIVSEINDDEKFVWVSVLLKKLQNCEDQEEEELLSNLQKFELSYPKIFNHALRRSFSAALSKKPRDGVKLSRKIGKPIPENLIQELYIEKILEGFNIHKDLSEFKANLQGLIDVYEVTEIQPRVSHKLETILLTEMRTSDGSGIDADKVIEVLKIFPIDKSTKMAYSRSMATSVICSNMKYGKGSILESMIHELNPLFQECFGIDFLDNPAHMDEEVVRESFMQYLSKEIKEIDWRRGIEDTESMLKALRMENHDLKITKKEAKKIYSGIISSDYKRILKFQEFSGIEFSEFPDLVEKLKIEMENYFVVRAKNSRKIAHSEYGRHDHEPLSIDEIDKFESAIGIKLPLESIQNIIAAYKGNEIVADSISVIEYLERRVEGE